MRFTGWPRVVVPILVVASTTYGALSGDTWWSTLCIGLLAAMAVVFWLLDELGGIVDNGWRPLARNAVEQQKVTAHYGAAVTSITAEAIRALNEYDEGEALRLTRELADAYGVYSEHVS